MVRWLLLSPTASSWRPGPGSTPHACRPHLTQVLAHGTCYSALCKDGPSPCWAAVARTGVRVWRGCWVLPGRRENSFPTIHVLINPGHLKEPPSSVLLTPKDTEEATPPLPLAGQSLTGQPWVGAPGQMKTSTCQHGPGGGQQGPAEASRGRLPEQRSWSSRSGCCPIQWHVPSAWHLVGTKRMSRKEGIGEWEKGEHDSMEKKEIFRER